jgi:hypothetical protein
MAMEIVGVQLARALLPFADLLPGSLEIVGGSTIVAPQIKVQWIKDARAALALSGLLCPDCTPGLLRPRGDGTFVCDTCGASPEGVTPTSCVSDRITRPPAFPDQTKIKTNDKKPRYQ